ncbi:leucine-rich repeat-containing protein 69 [Microcaecilia unicolor]|uniref:Leucine-rich repeat-containing protein 69 n=1 Tax=Microcaecilia unicolor TaxID=1415580 RepID=A0A6P7X629_9AMPH|nr:leucine-rich repeat-containing protein 69 [Microcaecilia unicolor]
MADLLVLRAIRGHARVLNLNGKKLWRVPRAVTKLTLLTSLRLQNNRITELSPELAVLSHLTVLYLGNNVFEEVPEVLKYLDSLQKLYMFGNRITKISSNIFDGLQNLKILNLNNNKITYIPSQIYRLRSLRHLSLNGNQLKYIPKEFGLMEDLFELQLAKNQLVDLPEDIGCMTNLCILCLSRNQLSELPEKLCELKNLKILDVAGNQIQSFPTAIENLPLREFYYEENPLLVKKTFVTGYNEEVLSLREMAARYILNYTENRHHFLQIAIRKYPEVWNILSNKNVCTVCGSEFLTRWLECVKFMDMKKVIKQTSNMRLITIKIF